MLIRILKKSYFSVLECEVGVFYAYLLGILAFMDRDSEEAHRQYGRKTTHAT